MNKIEKDIEELFSTGFSFSQISLDESKYDTQIVSQSGLHDYQGELVICENDGGFGKLDQDYENGLLIYPPQTLSLLQQSFSTQRQEGEHLILKDRDIAQLQQSICSPQCLNKDHLSSNNQKSPKLQDFNKVSEIDKRQLKNFHQFCKKSLIKIAQQKIPKQIWSKLKNLQIANVKKKSQKDCQNLLNYNNYLTEIFFQSLRQKELYRIVMLSSIAPQRKQAYLRNLPRIKPEKQRGILRIRVIRKKRSDARSSQ